MDLLNVNAASIANSFLLRYTATGNIRAIVNNSGTAFAASSTTLSTGTWGHACAVFTSATSRAAYLNGASKGTNATSATPAGINQTDIGSGAGFNFANADIAECAIWNIALADADVAIIGSATTPISPLLMHPESLVFYAPLLSPVVNPEIELMSARNLTPSASVPTLAVHPRIFYRKPRWVGKMKAAFTNFPDRYMRNWERPDRLITREVIGY
jgi:hypothetical protein